MKKYVLTLFTVAALALTGSAQDYASAVGLRLGYPISLSFKTFLGGGPGAVEAFVNYRSEDLGSV